MKHPTMLWAGAMDLDRALVWLLSRLEVSGAVPQGEKPLIIASNHVSPFDPLVLTAACRIRGLAPAFLVHAGPFEVPVVGAFLRACGHIRVDRDTPSAPQALEGAKDALAQGRAVVIYPEGRISLDPGLWPERGKTGIGRLVMATGATVVPVAIWGAHEVLPYAAPKGMWPRVWHSLRHRPKVRVHFGEPLDLSDVDTVRIGAAQRITDRVIDAVIECLIPLRAGEPDLPRYTDPSRPTETRRSYRRKTMS